jgi:hypothetical protein
MKLSPSDEPQPEDLPLRHRKSRAREAEKIRQEFIRSQKKMIFQETEQREKEFSENEQ